MTIPPFNAPTPRKPLRLWPGVLAAALLLLVRFVIPMVAPVAGGTAILGGVAGALAIIVWWLFFSRAPWSDRAGAIVIMVGAVLATSRIVHESIANGMMGMLLPLSAIPVSSFALVAAAAASRRLSEGRRRAAMAAAILLACGAFALVRTGGITGDAVSDFHWRWTRTPEERLLAQSGGDVTPPSSAPATAASPDTPPPVQDRVEAIAPTPAAAKPVETPPAAPAGGAAALPPAAPAATEAEANWPGFRGPDRDDVVRGERIETDWTGSRPVELWRRPIGPGWSSFAVRGDLLYTQEQRGDDEIVACYHLATGQPVWMHRDATRFWESNGGAGPRATPTISNGRVYAFGATGILNALDARDGSVVWSRNAASDTGTEIPGWGFASSPLVVEDLVVVHAGVLVAYDRATGERRWVGPARGAGYSSPHLLTIDSVTQILMMSGAGATSVAPSDGALLWVYSWPGSPIVQPAQIADGAVLISTADGMGGNGTRRITAARGPGGWTVEERWTSSGLKPYFNDFVVHKGHAFGFDGNILASIDLEDGKRTWKGGRYGNGQLLLLPEQDLLLVLSEDGELVLVGATPDRFNELARFPVLNGKTWNHPVLIGDVLLVRNGEEMAAFRMPRVSR